MDLLDQIRAARDAESVALINPVSSIDVTGLGTGIGMEGMMAAAAFEDQIASMIANANDADLLAAYQRTDGESANPEADALLAEIERRGLER